MQGIPARARQLEIVARKPMASSEECAVSQGDEPSLEDVWQLRAHGHGAFNDGCEAFVQLVGWLWQLGEDTDVVSLVIGCLFSGVTALWLRFVVGGWAGRFFGQRH